MDVEVGSLFGVSKGFVYLIVRIFYPHRCDDGGRSLYSFVFFYSVWSSYEYLLYFQHDDYCSLVVVHV